MGTNIQRHNLTAEDLRRQGARGVQRQPRPHPPRHHPVDPRVVPRRGLRRRGDLHLPEHAAPPEGVGARGEGARAQRAGGAARARRLRQVRHARQAALRRRLHRPHGHAALEQRPRALRTSPSRSSPRTTTSQAKYLVEGGVDVLLVETAQDILEVKAALTGFERLFAELGRRIPVQAQVTLDTSGRMLLGTDIASALTTLEALRVDVIGLNCSTGPGAHARAGALPHRARVAARSRCIPNAGLPLNTGTGEAVYPLEPLPMAGDAARVRARSSASASSAAAAAPRRSTSRPSCTRRAARRRPAAPIAPHAPRGRRCRRAMRATALRQDPAPLLVGERVNSQGSRKVKRLLLADDYEGILEVAREQAGLRRARARRLRRRSPSAPTKRSRWRSS